jgi:putative membrane protein
MTLRWLVAFSHLLALPIGLGAVWMRARSLGGTLDAAGLRRVFVCDTLWGLAALLWIATGAWRAFGGLEKGTAYYVANPFFHAKMGLLGLVLALEVWPVVTLIRWRRRQAKTEPIDTTAATTLARISFVQAGLIVLMMLTATALARCVGT